MTERELFEVWRASNPIGYKTRDQYAKAAFLEGMRIQKIRCTELMKNNTLLREQKDKHTDWSAA